MVDYQCNGSKPVFSGNATRRCSEGIWTGEIPSCDISDDCEQLDQPTNGFTERQGSETSTGSTFMFFCFPTFELFPKGANKVTCTREKPWKSPTCKPKYTCKKLTPFTLEGLEVVYYGDWSNKSHVSARMLASYSCKRNDTILQGAAHRSCLGNGSWTEKEPRCVTLLSRNQSHRHPGVVIDPAAKNEHKEEEPSGSPISLLTVVLGLGLLALVAVFSLVVYKGSRKLRQLQGVNVHRRSQVNTEEDRVRGQKFKMSYKMGMHVDDDVLSTDFGLKTPDFDNQNSFLFNLPRLQVTSENDFQDASANAQQATESPVDAPAL